MSAFKSSSSLRSLVLTPQQTPTFHIPSRSPLLFLSPRLQQTSLDRTGLLSDQDDDSLGAEPPLSPVASPRFLLRLPRFRPPHQAIPDTDLTTRAAMSLPHVTKVTTPYGFRAVLAKSPCTRRRESLFHRNNPVMVTVIDTDPQDLADPPPPPAHPGRSPVRSRPIRALGLQVIKELKRPAAALKALSPATRRTRPL